MASKEDSARLLREAWSSVPLVAIRDFVGETISRLGTIKPEDLLGREVSGALYPASVDPVWRALQTCADELRSESGIADSEDAQSARNGAFDEQVASESGWTAVYQEALAQYRAESVRALRAWLDSLQPPVSSVRVGE